MTHNARRNNINLIVGLGNPGFRYRNTRHNVGFLIVKEIAARSRIPLKRKAYKGIMGKGSVSGKKAALFMPLTYMNLSGQAVREAFIKEKIKPERLLVIYDDADLEFGSVRLREKGSAGGHKGLSSIIKALGTSEFPRLRIGIGKGRKAEGLTEFVLRPFEHSERSVLKEVIAKAIECVLVWSKEGAPRAMSLFNRPSRSKA